MATDLKLINFPGAPNLPIFVAQEKGFFEAVGIKAILTTTPSSTYQVEQMMKGTFQIAGTAIDNIVACAEGQGVSELEESSDLFAFMGATQLELSLIVAPEIHSFTDLKGRTLALDALTTGFAFILYRMIENAGLSQDAITMVPVGATPARWETVKAGQHSGTLTIEPFTTIAREAGFKVLESSLQTVKAYQGGSFAARRNWATNNSKSLMSFISGYLDGLNWTLNPSNREEGAEILLRRMPEINPKAINNVMDKLLSPMTGLQPEAAINSEGFKTVLELRSQYGGFKLADRGKYLDLSFYEQVMAIR